MRDHALKTLITTATIIEAVPPGGIPSGTMYAMVMNAISLDDYEGVIYHLKALGILKVHANYLTRGHDWERARKGFIMACDMLIKEVKE